ncbi:hypothetical protein ES702_03185 [subsurface metagenome]
MRVEVSVDVTISMLAGGGGGSEYVGVLVKSCEIVCVVVSGTAIVDAMTTSD